MLSSRGLGSAGLSSYRDQHFKVVRLEMTHLSYRNLNVSEMSLVFATTGDCISVHKHVFQAQKGDLRQLRA